MTHQENEIQEAIPTLGEEELITLQNQSAHYLYSWVRDITNHSPKSKQSAALNLLESFIGAATNHTPKIGADVLHRHVYFEEEVRNHTNQF